MLATHRLDDLRALLADFGAAKKSERRAPKCTWPIFAALEMGAVRDLEFWTSVPEFLDGIPEEHAWVVGAARAVLEKWRAVERDHGDGAMVNLDDEYIAYQVRNPDTMSDLGRLRVRHARAFRERVGQAGYRRAHQFLP